MKPEEPLGDYLRERKPAADEEHSALDRVWDGLRSDATNASNELTRDFQQQQPHAGSMKWIAAAAIIIFAIALPPIFIRYFSPNESPALMEAVNTQPIKYGEVVRTDAGSGSVLSLSDGSRVEMRANSELTLDAAIDGLRIHLNRGSVIVNAAKQRNGHLYVQTRDVTVSVIGTVFLVNAEVSGSRVAVIQGEVRVQKGVTEQKLLSGEQVATDPSMQSQPVSEEIAWSRNAETHLALLQQTKAAPRLEFEVVSIRRETPPPRDQVLSAELTGFGCQGVDGVRRAPLGQLPNAAAKGRCMGRMTALPVLIGYAYDVFPRRVREAPDWREPGQPLDWGFQIEAKAENPSTATLADLREMLQHMLEDRFKLRFHRATTDCQGYALTVADKVHTLTPDSGDEEPPRTIAQNRNRQILKGKSSIESLANALTGFAGMPVIDRTSLTGIYNYSLTLNRVFTAPSGNTPPPDGRPNPLAGGVCGGTNTPRGPRQNQSGEILEIVGYDPPVTKAVEDQLGLRMESGKIPVETIVVDHAEKPPLN